MDTATTKREKAIEACNKVIDGIEDGTITVSSSLLLCKKIARLINDQEGMEWLEYEYGGYPRNSKGHIVHDAWVIAKMHGRTYKAEDKEGKFNEYMFSEMCGELESSIESTKLSLQNFTTSGFSVSGDYALVATSRMSEAISQNTSALLKRIDTCEKRLSILKSQYYEYAVKWQIELSFGNIANSIFDEYREKVDRYFSVFPISTIQKLNAIEDMMEDGNPERYSQVVTSCRRLWSEIAKTLFSEFLPNYQGKTFKSRTGKELDISDDHDNNKISAVIETLQAKAAKNTLVGSEIIYLIDWIEQINKKQNTGVHDDVTRKQAMQCIIHTYIALGDILTLKNEVETMEHSASY